MVKVTFCAIESCPSSRGHHNPDTPLSFFQPTTQLKQKTWSRALGIELTSKHRICQLHFKDDSFRTGEENMIGFVNNSKVISRKVLKDGALPTIEHQSVYDPETQTFFATEHHSKPELEDEELQASYKQEVSMSSMQDSETLDVNVKAKKSRDLAAKHRPYACEVCGKRFILKHHVTTHMITHSGDRPFICGKCGRGFTRKQCLNGHMQTHGIFVCSVCGAQFDLRQNLQIHSRSHKLDLLFACGVCGRRFRHRRHLMAHVKYHSAERPHVCGGCGSSFVMETQLIQHMKTHGRLTLTCQYCDKEFLKEKTLTAHILTHSEFYTSRKNEAHQELNEDEYTNKNEIEVPNKVLTEKEIEVPLSNGIGNVNYEQYTHDQGVMVEQYEQNGQNSNEIMEDDNKPPKYIILEPNKIHKLEENEMYEDVDMARLELNKIKKEPTEGDPRSDSEYYVTVDEVPIEFHNEE